MSLLVALLVVPLEALDDLLAAPILDAMLVVLAALLVPRKAPFAALAIPKFESYKYKYNSCTYLTFGSHC